MQRGGCEAASHTAERLVVPGPGILAGLGWSGLLGTLDRKRDRAAVRKGQTAVVLDRNTVWRRMMQGIRTEEEGPTSRR